MRCATWPVNACGLFLHRGHASCVTMSGMPMPKSAVPGHLESGWQGNRLRRGSNYQSATQASRTSGGSAIGRCPSDREIQPATDAGRRSVGTGHDRIDDCYESRPHGFGDRKRPRIRSDTVVRRLQGCKINSNVSPSCTNQEIRRRAGRIASATAQ